MLKILHIYAYCINAYVCPSAGHKVRCLKVLLCKPCLVIKQMHRPSVRLVACGPQYSITILIFFLILGFLSPFGPLDPSTHRARRWSGTSARIHIGRCNVYRLRSSRSKKVLQDRYRQTAPSLLFRCLNLTKHSIQSMNKL